MNTTSSRTGSPVNQSNGRDGGFDHQAFDELAEMFLTGPDQSSRGRTDQPAQRAATELLLIGHLPVRAGVWLTPYADARARQNGQATLIRISEDNTSTVEVLRGKRPDENSIPTTLADAIAAIGSDAGLWIVHQNQSAGVEQLFKSIRPDRVTVLTSADEAALVAAYEQIKAVVDQCRLESNSDQIPAFGLAVVGATEDRAAQIAQRLSRTSEQFLGVPVEPLMCLPRIDAGARCSVAWRFPADRTLNAGETLQRIQQVIDRGPAQQQPLEFAAAGSPTAPMQDRSETNTPTEDRRRETTERESQHPLHDGPPPASPFVDKPDPSRHGEPASRASTADSLVGEARHRRRAKVVPKPVADMELKISDQNTARDDHAAASANDGSWAKHVDGLHALPVRCPNHERVELAVDAAGRLHLLGCEQTLREMLHVEPWVRAHHELINMACPQQSFDVSKAPKHHVFTDEPVKLADLHGTDLRLHLLTTVEVNGESGWYCAPLNAG